MTRRVVFDCMVFLQGAANPDGPAAACLRLAEKGHVELCISSEILSEVRDVLTRPKMQHRFSALTEETVSAFLARGTSTLLEFSHITSSSMRVWSRMASASLPPMTCC